MEDGAGACAHAEVQVQAKLVNAMASHQRGVLVLIMCGFSYVRVLTCSCAAGGWRRRAAPQPDISRRCSGSMRPCGRPGAGRETFSREPFLSCAACFGRDISRAARPRRMSALADLRAFMRRYRLNSTPVERRRCPFAGVAELVDARDLGSRGESRGGSSPSARTTPDQRHLGRRSSPRHRRRGRGQNM